MNGGGEGLAAPATSGAATAPLDWRFSQVFGERTAGEEVQEVDIISAIEFDRTGDHLATGDRGGRVVLFERTDAKDHGGHRKDLERMDYSIGRHPEFRYKTEFQSHEPEFDYLKSLEIEEKINKIRWCQTANGALFLLSTNDKTIKFWKVQEKKVKKVSEMNVDWSKSMGNGPFVGGTPASSKPYLANGVCKEKPIGFPSNDASFPSGGSPSLHLPLVTSPETSLVARCRRVYAHAHDYHINSISNNSDGETFISADDLRINLWNLEISNQSFNIVDVKPTNMEDLTGRTCSTMMRIPCFSDFNCFDFMACVKIVIKRINESLSRIGAGYTSPGLSSVISCILYPLKKLAVLTFYLPSMLEDFNV